MLRIAGLAAAAALTLSFHSSEGGAAPVRAHRVSMEAADLAQVVNPADAQRGPGTPDTLRTDGRRRSWEMPEVVVYGERPHRLREEQRIGTYLQPRWTATRRFPTTRVYVVPDGKAEFEVWLRPTWKDDGTVEMRSLWEFEFGLPHRLQLDLYLRTDQVLDPGGEPAGHGQQIEIRWALANWGRLWGNPTLYLEWVNLYDSPDKIEPKLLLGGQLSEGWHGGLNLVGEFQMGGEREYEYQLTGGISRTLIDSRLSFGAEGRWIRADVAADRGNFEDSFTFGPSLQYRPLPQMTINVAPLFGVTEDSDDAQLFFNTGWEF